MTAGVLQFLWDVLRGKFFMISIHKIGHRFRVFYFGIFMIFLLALFIIFLIYNHVVRPELTSYWRSVYTTLSFFPFIAYFGQSFIFSLDYEVKEEISLFDALVSILIVQVYGGICLYLSIEFFKIL